MELYTILLGWNQITHELFTDIYWWQAGITTTSTVVKLLPRVTQIMILCHADPSGIWSGPVVRKPLKYTQLTVDHKSCFSPFTWIKTHCVVSFRVSIPKSPVFRSVGEMFGSFLGFHVSGCSPAEQTGGIKPVIGKHKINNSTTKLQDVYYLRPCENKSQL